MFHWTCREQLHMCQFLSHKPWIAHRRGTIEWEWILSLVAQIISLNQCWKQIHTTHHFSQFLLISLLTLRKVDSNLDLRKVARENTVYFVCYQTYYLWNYSTAKSIFSANCEQCGMKVRPKRWKKNGGQSIWRLPFIHCELFLSRVSHLRFKW
jgi:hypothetical protein